MTERTSRFVFVVVLAVALSVTAGCLGAEFEPMDIDIEPDAEEVETDETGDEILASSLEAVGDAETQTVEAENAMALGASRLFSLSMSMDSSGEFVTDEFAHVSTDGVVDVQAFGIFDNETAFETESYSTPNATYTRSAEGDEPMSDWSVNETGIDDRPSPFGFEGIEKVLGDADAQLEGVETVDGDETYVLSLDLDAEGVILNSMEAFALYGSDELEEEEGDDPEDEESDEADLDALDAYVWVDRDTREPVRLAYYVLATGLDDEGGDGDDEGIIDAEGAMEFYFDADYTYGEPVDTELPFSD